jgi:hypothetical protein
MRHWLMWRFLWRPSQESIGRRRAGGEISECTSIFLFARCMVGAWKLVRSQSKRVKMGREITEGLLEPAS